MEEHYNTFSDKVIEILTELEAKKINKYKANNLIQEQLKYCTERDERIRIQKLEIWIESQKETYKL
jgi:uncharacterized Rmd1/YagE family protein